MRKLSHTSISSSRLYEKLERYINLRDCSRNCSCTATYNDNILKFLVNNEAISENELFSILQEVLCLSNISKITYKLENNEIIMFYIYTN